MQKLGIPSAGFGLSKESAKQHFKAGEPLLEVGEGSLSPTSSEPAYYWNQKSSWFFSQMPSSQHSQAPSDNDDESQTKTRLRSKAQAWPHYHESYLQQMDVHRMSLQERSSVLLAAEPPCLRLDASMGRSPYAYLCAPTFLTSAAADQSFNERAIRARTEAKGTFSRRCSSDSISCFRGTGGVPGSRHEDHTNHTEEEMLLKILADVESRLSSSSPEGV